MHFGADAAIALRRSSQSTSGLRTNPAL